MNRLSPYQPSKQQPWNRRRAAHLLRRTGFEPSFAELDRALQDGFDATIERVFDKSTDTTRHDELNAMGERLAKANDIARLQAWWMQRLCYTANPLHARMSLLWHDHFATSNAKVQSAVLMLEQLRTFETLGMGSFETMLLAISRDPAMIIYLDGNDNVKGRPNENYARELFELFALDVGNYSEDDIKEAARAFTGWHQKNGRFRFDPRSHDDGSKTVFDTTAALDGDDVVALTIAHPACGVFIGRRLLEEFVTPHPNEQLVTETANHLRTNSFDIGKTIKTIVMSQAMFDDANYRVRIKSPVEFVIGLARSLDLSQSARQLANSVNNMGQRLFEPPSVKGWDGHRAWLNSTTMLVRLNAAMRAVSIADELIAEVKDHRDVITALADRCFDGTLPPTLQTQLAGLDARNALERILASPEYQMG